jgi:hypothetical protein
LLLLLADDDDVIIMRIYLFLHVSRLGTLLITHEVLGPATPVELYLCEAVGKVWGAFELFYLRSSLPTGNEMLSAVHGYHKQHSTYTSDFS